MSQQQAFQRRTPILLSDYRYPSPMSREPVEGAKYPARWVWEQGLDGKIYFKVNDGVFGKDDRNAKMKEVEMSVYDRGALFELMKDACDNANFTKTQYHVKKVTFGAGGRLNEHASTLGIFTVMRSQEGRISVGYTKGTYKVMFDFKSPFDSMIMVAKDGEPREDAGLMSRVFCKAFINFCGPYLDKLEVEGYKPREPKNAGGNNNSGGNSGWNGNRGGNGGNNWNGNGGNNNSQRKPDPTSFDDDIDF
ncbi:hypothetical protein ACP1_0128 [Aeromonas phage ACP1]